MQRRAELLSDTFNSMANTKCTKIQGAMYAFPEVIFSQKALKKAEKEQVPADFMYCMDMCCTFVLIMYSSFCLVYLLLWWTEEAQWENCHKGQMFCKNKFSGSQLALYVKYIPEIELNYFKVKIWYCLYYQTMLKPFPWKRGLQELNFGASFMFIGLIFLFWWRGKGKHFFIQIPSHFDDHAKESKQLL